MRRAGWARRNEQISERVVYGTAARREMRLMIWGECHANESLLTTKGCENNLRKSPKGLVALFQEDVLIGVGVASGVTHPDV